MTLSYKIKMFKKRSILFKYLIAFMLIIVIPILIINVAIYNLYNSTLLKSTSDRVLQSMEQISVGIENEIRNLLFAEATVSEANDYEILDLVTQWNRETDPKIKFNISGQIDSKIRYLFNYRNNVESIVFFYKNKGFYYYMNSPNIDENEIRSMDWYTNALNNKGKSNILFSSKSITNNSFNKYALCLSMSPNLPNLRNDVEMIYIAFKTNIFDNIYSSLRFNRIGEMLIIDDAGNIMVSKNKDLMGKNINEFGYLKRAFRDEDTSYIETVNGKKTFISTYTVESTNWRIVNLIEYKALTNEIDKIFKYVVIVSIVIIMLFLTFSLFFFRGIIIPVNSLIKGMKEVEKGDFNIEVKTRGKDEIQHLGKAFNKMIIEIRNLMEQRDTKEKERSKAEIEALQSQINPHFISNTLNAIRLMAMIAKADNIKNITEAFMKLLTASFGKGGTMTTIEAEIDNLNNYIYIMKVRYGDKFDVDLQIDEALDKYCILKLILQPILENAMLHGLSEMEEKGKIYIRGLKLEEDIEFEIRDNGKGMTDEQIANLLSEVYSNPKSFSSIGVRNVDKRIKLNHGSKYGIKIESKLDEYTSVKIVLPLIQKELGENNYV